MRIAIDARVIERKMTGIGRYLDDLLNGLTDHDSVNEYTLFTTVPLEKYNKEYYRNVVLDKLKFNSKMYSPLWLNFVLKNHLLENNFDVFFSPNNLCPAVSSGKLKSVITIHDIMFKMDKNYYSALYRTYLNIMLGSSVKSASKIITISEYSKKDIIKYYGVNKDKLDVIYRAAHPKFRLRSPNEYDWVALKSKYGLKENFIMYVGLIENRKNISGILRIADICRSKRNDFQLVLVGRPGYGFSEIKKEIDNRTDNVSYLNYVDDKDLPLLYNSAKIFLFPSYYEGFGLPVLEAMQSGVPVVTSNTSSLPEIVDGFGIMHQPNDIKSFAESIIKLLDDSNYYNECRKNSIEGAKRFSQAKLVKEHIGILNNLK